VGAVGLVPARGRGALPFTLLRGETLVTHTTRALSDAGVRVVAEDTSWASLQALGEHVVLMDPLCPLTPARFVAQLVAAPGTAVVVGVRPVTDTIKQVDDDWVGATLDRDALATVTSPIVIPSALMGVLEEPRPDDFSALVTTVREQVDVRLVEAPSIGRRVADDSAVLVLEAVAELAG